MEKGRKEIWDQMVVELAPQSVWGEVAGSPSEQEYCGGSFIFSTNFDALLESALLEEPRWQPKRALVKVHGGLQLEPLRRSISELQDSSLSRLFRVVRNWVTEAEEEPHAEVPFAPIDEPVVVGGSLLNLLTESQHRLLDRDAGKGAWEWYADWRMLALALAEEEPSLSGREVLDLILGEMIVRRLAPKPPRPCIRHARAERLVRLATSVIPNAPPRPLLDEQVPTGAG